MNVTYSNRRSQTGSFMIEALIGILIFFIGALTMIGLQANGIAVQTDAQYRIEASNLADRIVGEITVGVDRTTTATIQNSLNAYAYNATRTATCNYSGGAQPTAPAAIGKWISDVSSILPTSNGTMRQILVETANANRVTVTICWQTASDSTPRRHTVISYIN